MPRFFVRPEAVSADTIVITGDDVNHIRNVLRMGVGDEISVSDGAGRDYYGVLESLDRDRVTVRIENSWDSFVELPARILLFQGLPKADKMELIIQKAVELGVYQIVPVVMKRSVVRLDPEREAKKLARWRGIAESAAKQSGRGVIPQVAAPVAFQTALSQAGALDAILLPYERARDMARSRELIHQMRGKHSIGVFIGPEGGFDETEIAAALAAGAKTMTLGRRILRTETAGLAVLSLLMFELDV